MRVVSVGGGAGGLLTALLLRRDGHDVTVLERDAEGPPADDEQAWDSWTRKGVSQLRQPHGFIGRTRAVLSEELPEVWDRVLEADTYRVDLRRFAPEQEALVESDRRLQVEVMRRTTFERTLASVVDETPGIDVRRGVAVTGLRADRSENGTPLVSGVHTREHGDVSADLVIDSSGRRTAAPRWLDDVGAPVDEWSESDGFTYHSLWFRTHDGTYPPNIAGFFGGMAPGLIALLFPGDAGVFGVAMVGLGSDKPLRRLRDTAVFTSVASEFTPIAGWVDPDVSAPISQVLPMGAIHNRRLRFWNGDGPSAHGFVNLGDSALSTNPSLGRGIALALVGALELRSVLRTTDDPQRVAVEYDQVKEERLIPWLWDAVESDRGMRHVFATAIGEATDTTVSDRTLMSRASMQDMECWRRWTGVNQAFELPSSCLEDGDLMDRARTIGSGAPPPSYDLTRQELEHLLT
ncbi:MAG: FAD-dependent monooxygenase [Acidimicrobiia bacterium]|nr:FAD-dependent monooxygenase [Acidimicrobiia bacterium]